jgi:hypothetical protein
MKLSKSLRTPNAVILHFICDAIILRLPKPVKANLYIRGRGAEVAVGWQHPPDENAMYPCCPLILAVFTIGRMRLYKAGTESNRRNSPETIHLGQRSPVKRG